MILLLDSTNTVARPLVGGTTIVTVARSMSPSGSMSLWSILILTSLSESTASLSSVAIGACPGTTVTVTVPVSHEAVSSQMS